MADLFRINTNVAALRALTTLQGINDDIVDVQKRIATGKRINDAGDDPARYFTSRLFETSISSLVAGQIEIERGIDFLETNNVRLDQVTDLLIEMTNLANMANSGAVTSAEQQAISVEVNLLVNQIANILASGVSTAIFTGFTIGTLSDVAVSGGIPTLSSLGITASSLIVTGSSAQFTTTLRNLDSALKTVLRAEETIGSYVSRLEFELDDLTATEIADRASLSTLVDADLAEEQVRLTSLQILQQTSLVGLIQANSAPTSILGLIQG